MATAPMATLGARAATPIVFAILSVYCKLRLRRLTVPSHYLNQCLLITNGVLWHSQESNFTKSAHEINPWHRREITLPKLSPYIPGGSELMTSNTLNKRYHWNSRQDLVWYRGILRANISMKTDGSWRHIYFRDALNSLAPRICGCDFKCLIFKHNWLTSWIFAVELS